MSQAKPAEAYCTMRTSFGADCLLGDPHVTYRQAEQLRRRATKGVIAKAYFDPKDGTREEPETNSSSSVQGARLWRAVIGAQTKGLRLTRRQELKPLR